MRELFSPESDNFWIAVYGNGCVRGFLVTKNGTPAEVALHIRCMWGQKIDYMLEDLSFSTRVTHAKASSFLAMMSRDMEGVCVLSSFACCSLWGKLGGLHACGGTFVHIVPLPNILVTRLFSKTRLKRKDFREIARLAWAQEVPSSNLGAPTTYFFIFNELSLTLRRLWPNLDPIGVQI